ncbi:selT-like protein [Leptotrombidium deliense]|uniref:SelT-like protein n=1 Tax=Leptotrombidium deliense TaxID=299467 RepID=A0A443SUJ0_9ACAR|nr:selT-like protein [Leptotrombidium deliense]
MERLAFSGLFVLFLAFTAKDLLFKDSGDEHVDTNDEFAPTRKKEIPNTSFRHMSSGPRYRRVFEEYSVILREKYPSLQLIGDNYPPPAYKLTLARFIGIAKLVVIALVLSNINPFSYFGIATPNLWLWLTQHKVYGCLMTFFISNMIEGQLIATGAFEISLNDVPVWSKLDTGRVPSPPELFQIIDSHQKLHTNIEF